MEHETYVSLETAKLLKQAGFDWKVYTCYYHSEPNKISHNGSLCVNFNGYAFQYISISAPTLAVAQRWLREVKELNVNVDTWPAALWRWVVWKINPERKVVASKHSNYKTYEQALEVGIQKCLMLLLKK